MMRPLNLILLVNFFAAGAAVAQTPTQPAAPKAAKKEEISAETELVLRSLSERYEKLRNWKAKFTHNNSSPALGTNKFSEGDFIFAYPNRFRFSLNGPSEISDFISDGQQAWYVRFPKGRKQAALVQHFPKAAELELDKYLILLRGLPKYSPESRAKLLKDFKITSRVNQKILTLILEPRLSDDLTKVELSFEQLKDHPDSALIVDTLGGESSVKLNDVTRIEKIDPNEFKPKYPKDSKIEKVGN
jgi:outer membrane lipoprotein-sorting protein